MTAKAVPVVSSDPSSYFLHNIVFSAFRGGMLGTNTTDSLHYAASTNATLATGVIGIVAG